MTEALTTLRKALLSVPLADKDALNFFFTGIKTTFIDPGIRRKQNQAREE